MTLYHVMYSFRYYPRFHVTVVGLGTYYPRIGGSACVWHRVFWVSGVCSSVQWVVSQWKMKAPLYLQPVDTAYYHRWIGESSTPLREYEISHPFESWRILHSTAVSTKPIESFRNFREECRDSTLQYATTLFPDLLSTKPWLRSSHICLCVRTLSTLTVCQYERFQASAQVSFAVRCRYTIYVGSFHRSFGEFHG